MVTPSANRLIGSTLFNEVESLSSVFGVRRQAIPIAVDALPADRFAAQSDPVVVEEMLQADLIPELELLDPLAEDQVSEDVIAREVASEAGYATHRTIPFVGVAYLFDLSHDGQRMTRPIGILNLVEPRQDRDGTVTFVVMSDAPSDNAAKPILEEQIALLHACVEQTNSEVRHYNETLRPRVVSAVEKRRARMSRPALRD